MKTPPTARKSCGSRAAWWETNETCWAPDEGFFHLSHGHREATFGIWHSATGLPSADLSRGRAGRHDCHFRGGADARRGDPIRLATKPVAEGQHFLPPDRPGERAGGIWTLRSRA